MVHFVGAGSGAPDLITVRGARLLGEADIVIYAGSLVNPALLDATKPGCEIHDSAKMTLEEVIAVIRQAEAEGKTTVRLHTGDSSIYGAVREQFDALEKLGYTSDATYPMYYFRQRFTPYHPSSRDWTQKGELKLLEIPNFADMLMESHDQPTESDRDQWPIFRTEGADALMLRVKNFLRFLELRGLPAVLCFYFHPWEFVQMQPRITTA